MVSQFFVLLNSFFFLFYWIMSRAYSIVQSGKKDLICYPMIFWVQIVFVYGFLCNKRYKSFCLLVGIFLMLKWRTWSIILPEISIWKFRYIYIYIYMFFRCNSFPYLLKLKLHIISWKRATCINICCQWWSRDGSSLIFPTIHILSTDFFFFFWKKHLYSF